MVQDVVDETELARANGTRANGAPVNGRPMNGKPRAPAQAVAKEVQNDQTDENIFLFIPNLIGEHHISAPVVKRMLIPQSCRLLSYRPLPRLALLHAAAPSTLQLLILHIMPT